MRSESPRRSTVGRSASSSPTAPKADLRKASRPATSSTTMRGTRLGQPGARGTALLLLPRLARLDPLRLALLLGEVRWPGGIAQPLRLVPRREVEQRLE